MLSFRLKIVKSLTILFVYFEPNKAYATGRLFCRIRAKNAVYAKRLPTREITPDVENSVSINANFPGNGNFPVDSI